MDSQDWRDMARVYFAGAQRARGWSHNSLMQQLADVLEEMTTQCETNAWVVLDRLYPEAPLEHRHVHWHPNGTVHVHDHEHPAGSDPENHHHDHEPEPPPESLFPSPWTRSGP